MEIQLAEACDLFPYAQDVPINCKVRLLPDEIMTRADILRVTHTDGNNSATSIFQINKGETEEILIPIPYIPFREVSTLKLELFEGDEIISENQVDVKGFDENSIPINSDMTQDSMYVRTLPGSSMVAVTDFFDDIGEKVHYRDTKRAMQLSEAESCIKQFYKYFGQFEIIPQEYNSGYAKVTGVIDTMYDKIGSSYSLGLVFLSLATRLGLDGVACISNGRCFVGLALEDLLDEMEHPLFWKVPTVDTMVDYPYPDISMDKYLMIEVAPNMTFESSVDAAYDYCSTAIHWDGICRCSKVEDKISSLEKSTGMKRRIDSDD